MLRSLTTQCLFCELRLAAKESLLRPLHRTATTLQKRRPSRMELSDDVDKSRSRGDARVRLERRRADSPFGGMNMRDAGIRDPRRMPRVHTRDTVSPKDRPTAAARRNKSSPEPFKALKMQRALAPVPYQERTQVKARIAEIEQFDQFDLLPLVKDSVQSQVLKGLTSISPTPIQRLAISALLTPTQMFSGRKSKMQQFLLAAETGSGKTLAYLLPLLDALKRAETLESNDSSSSAKTVTSRRNAFELDPPTLSNRTSQTSGRPKAIILVPSAELVEQVGAVAKSLSHTIKFRAALLSANYSGTVIRNRLFAPQGVDVVITTPHLLSSIVQSDPNVVSQVTHLVIDEADSLFDRSFAPITGEILDRATPSLQQLILCSATIPRNLDSLLSRQYPDMIRLTTPKLHSIPRRVQMTVVDAEKDPYQGNKDLACADTIWNLGRQTDVDDVSNMSSQTIKYMIVFVNTRDQTAPLAEYLVRKGIDAIALDRDISTRKTGDALSAFVSSDSGSDSGFDADADADSDPDKNTLFTSQQYTPSISAPIAPRPTRHSSSPKPTASHKSLHNVKVLVTTDISSRGIDTTPVKNVILYDVPHSTVDFIHRLGRVGRMGRRGRAVVIVGKGDRRDVVREVRQGMFAGTALV